MFCFQIELPIGTQTTTLPLFKSAQIEGIVIDICSWSFLCFVATEFTAGSVAILVFQI